ncbi:HutD family protein [Trinickia violacea]|uniref:HutD family protein n=1 Tax=Trinickia violacea TaxID=2571746 RepID=A0A4P8INF7_9BURK|nr:HutD family protein [Trinickia violacea]QCP49055.1 HutD family protein [Trinickia violacea]
MASAQFPDAQLPAGVAVQPLASFPTQRWRNGGGTTRALAEAPDGGWRVSLADVERDGPYSRFAGMTRLSLVMEGSGVTLRDAADEVWLQRGIPVGYDGERAWQATLCEGPVIALNAMAAHGRFRARMTPLRHATLVPSGFFTLVLTLNGRCAWHTEDGNSATTPDEASVMTCGPEAGSLVLTPLPFVVQTGRRRISGFTAALVTIEPVGPSDIQKRGNNV